MDKRSEYESFRADLIGSLNGRNREGLLARTRAECKILKYANSVDWDRELVIQFCLKGPSGDFLGRSVFEQSFDDGSMKYMAEWYHCFAVEFNLLEA